MITKNKWKHAKCTNISDNRSLTIYQMTNVNQSETNRTNRNPFHDEDIPRNEKFVATHQSFTIRSTTHRQTMGYSDRSNVRCIFPVHFLFHRCWGWNIHGIFRGVILPNAVRFVTNCVLWFEMAAWILFECIRSARRKHSRVFVAYLTFLLTLFMY